MSDNPEQTPSTQHARYRGQRAFRGGHPFTANPYDLGTGESRAWSRGWNEKHADSAI